MVAQRFRKKVLQIAIRKTIYEAMTGKKINTKKWKKALNT